MATQNNSNSSLAGEEVFLSHPLNMVPAYHLASYEETREHSSSNTLVDMRYLDTTSLVLPSITASPLIPGESASPGKGWRALLEKQYA